MSRFWSPENSMFRSIGGDKPTMQRLLSKFLDEFQITLMEWEGAIEKKDAERLFEIQHRWLSGLRTLGYTELSKRISALQQGLIAAPEDLEDVKNLREELLAVQDEIGFEIKQMEALEKKEH